MITYFGLIYLLAQWYLAEEMSMYLKVVKWTWLPLAGERMLGLLKKKKKKGKKGMTMKQSYFVQRHSHFGFSAWKRINTPNLSDFCGALSLSFCIHILYPPPHPAPFMTSVTWILLCPLWILNCTLFYSAGYTSKTFTQVWWKQICIPIWNAIPVGFASIQGPKAFLP